MFNPGQSKEYLAVRVFSTKYIGDISYSALEKYARRGEVLPVLGYFPVHMNNFGNITKAETVLMSKTQEL